MVCSLSFRLEAMEKVGWLGLKFNLKPKLILKIFKMVSEISCLRLRIFQVRSSTVKLNEYFEMIVEIPRIKVGEKKSIETLINEKALLFAKYLRNKKKNGY